MINRVEQLREELKDRSVDAALIYKGENRRYISGFTGTSGYVLITMDKAIFITDFRYKDQAQMQCEGFEIETTSNDCTLTDVIKKYSISTLAFEEDYVTYQQYNDLKSRLDSLNLVPLEGLVAKLRQIKEEKEIDFIAQAASIGDKAFAHILNFLKPGAREIDIAIELEFYMKRCGASATSFNIIVASGKRSALPHGVASQKLIEGGDFVTLDFGCVYNGYCSDMTRTLVMGKATEKQREVYRVVLEAQMAALDVIRPGVLGKDVDKVARDIITKAGYGQYFGHNLGHSVGLEIHESPRLSPLEGQALQAGMVVTNEPGIYIPEFGGVRIEDLIVLTENGNRIISNTTKELIEL